jgi:hypothetical protein
VGASWVRKNILEKYPDVPLSVYVVWTSQLGGNRRSVDEGLFTDKRVRTYWDADDRVSTAIAGDLDPYNPVGFDVYALYGPDAGWDDHPTGIDDWGTPVIAETGRLERRVKALAAA